MTDQQHPITPPPELVQQWVANATGPDYEQVIATQAARWGADQELEACCEWVRDRDGYDAALGFRADRRPKPPSLKEEALKMLDNLERCTDGDYYTIRFALEQLDD